MAYIVETFTLFDGWTNTWTHENWAGITIPTAFDTREDAEAELSYFLQDEIQEYKNGNIAAVSNPENYRIVEIDDFDGIPEYIEDYFDPEIELDKMYEQYEKDNQK